MQKVLVTGSTGFVGRALTAALRPVCEVLEVSRAAGFDVTSSEHFEKLDRVDVVVHLAALTFVPDSFLRPRDYYETNVQGTLNVLEFARKVGARVIHMSSYVYGKPNYLPIDESHPLQAVNPYGHSKVMAESLCDFYGQLGWVDTCVIRPFNIYGPGQSQDFVIPKMIAGALREGRVELFDLRPRRDYIFLNDLVELVLACLKASWKGVVRLNAGAGQSHSLQDVLCLLGQILGKSVQVVDLNKPRPDEILDCISSNERARALVGWSPRTDLLSGLTQTLSAIQR